MSNFTTRQQDILLIMDGSGGCLAVACGLAAVVMVIILKLYKQLCYRLALYQVIAASLRGFALALQFLFVDKKLLETRVCTFVGFILQYSSTMELIWAGWVTFHLVSFVVFYKNLQKMELVYVVSSVLILALLAIVPFFTGSYGSSEAWCWIKDTANGKIERLALFYAPAIALVFMESIAVVVIVTMLVCRGCRKPLRQLSVTEKRALSQMLPLLAYPIIFCVAMIPSVVMVVHNAVSDRFIFSLNLADAILAPLWTVASSAVLIIHIVIVLVTRSLRRRKRTDHGEYVSPSMQSSAPSYGSVTVPSSTYYSLPEGSIDCD